MTRKEMYEAIKKYGLNDIIKARFGKNCTNVSNTELEEVINEFVINPKRECAEACEKLKEKAHSTDIKRAFVKLVSTLVAYEVIDDEDAESILENMK